MNSKHFYLGLTAFAFSLLMGCNPFSDKSFINLKGIANENLLAGPFKDEPTKYGDAQAVETVTTNSSTSSTVAMF